LRSLKEELGLNPDAEVPKDTHLNVREAVENAADQFSAKPGQEKGYFKAENLDKHFNKYNNRNIITDNYRV